MSSLSHTLFHALSQFVSVTDFKGIYEGVSNKKVFEQFDFHSLFTRNRIVAYNLYVTTLSCPPASMQLIFVPYWRKKNPSNPPDLTRLPMLI
jgi:hypothetical protein